MKINGKLAIQQTTMALTTSSPRTVGAAASVSTIATASDNTVWHKSGPLDTDWEQLFLSEGGAFTANIELANAEGIVLDQNVLGMVSGRITVGNGSATGGVPVAKYSEALSNKPDGTVALVLGDIIAITTFDMRFNTTSGYFSVRWWDGTVDTYASAADTGKAKFAGDWDGYGDKKVFVWSSTIDGP